MASGLMRCADTNTPPANTQMQFSEDAALGVLAHIRFPFQGSGAFHLASISSEIPEYLGSVVRRYSNAILVVANFLDLR